jgi:hypothetical protein
MEQIVEALISDDRIKSAANHSDPAIAIDQMADEIYSRYYCAGSSPENQKSADKEQIEESNFLSQIRSAYTLEPKNLRGWILTEISQDKKYATISKYNESRMVSTGSILGFRSETDMKLGEEIYYRRNYYADHQDSPFYYIHSISDRPLSSFRLIRIYFNLSVSSVPEFISSLTNMLNRYMIPFDFKCFKNPKIYSLRADTSVLYLNREYSDFIAPMIQELANQKLKWIDNIPLFTMELGKGISFAENPKNNDSFGSNISKILASTLYRNNFSADSTLKDLSMMINVEKPYLNTGSKYPYPFLKI